MKHALLLLVLLGLAATSCRPNSSTRNLSKYAENTFPDNCVYQAGEPYDVASLPAGNPDAELRNVVLMIGDGMGLEQLSAAIVANRGELHMARMPITGIARTYSADRLITDSGAAGTALATGHKTRNYTIGVDTAGRTLPTLTDVARASGRRTGITTVCRLNDATPAAFCSHHTDRDAAEQLAAQYLECGVDYIAGGGRKFWRNRKDERDILAEMADKGYHVYETTDALAGAEALPVAAVVDTLEMPMAAMRGDMFREMVRKALDLLDGQQGFFLMVEGSCIDDWCHANRLDKAVEELLDFDRTVGDVLHWAARDGHTLVVVTADHATGGMTLLDGDLHDGAVKVHFSSTGHNGICVPVFAYGPGAERFVGMYENSELSHKIAELLGPQP